MAVKVLIERTVRPGYEASVWEMIKELRGEAIRHRGYLTGETWRSLTDPKVFMVVSTWGTRQYWEDFSTNELRAKINDRINLLLSEPPIIKLYEEVSDIPEASPTRQNPSPRRRNFERQGN